MNENGLHSIRIKVVDLYSTSAHIVDKWNFTSVSLDWSSLMGRMDSMFATSGSLDCKLNLNSSTYLVPIIDIIKDTC